MGRIILQLIVRLVQYALVMIYENTTRVTPAMEAGIAGHVWSLGEIAALVN